MVFLIQEQAIRVQLLGAFSHFSKDTNYYLWSIYNAQASCGAVESCSECQGTVARLLQSRTRKYPVFIRKDPFSPADLWAEGHLFSVGRGEKGRRREAWSEGLSKSLYAEIKSQKNGCLRLMKSSSNFARWDKVDGAGFYQLLGSEPISLCRLWARTILSHLPFWAGSHRCLMWETGRNYPESSRTWGSMERRCHHWGQKIPC